MSDVIRKAIAEVYGESALKRLMSDMAIFGEGTVSIPFDPQCACSHAQSAHGDKDIRLTAEKVKKAAESLRSGLLIPRPCQSCGCLDFETDNLEWLLKRDALRKQDKRD